MNNNDWSNAINKVITVNLQHLLYHKHILQITSFSLHYTIAVFKILMTFKQYYVLTPIKFITFL